MRLYLESSAVLAWLFAEAAAAAVSAVLDDAEFVISSDVTRVECDRALIRARTVGALSEPRAVDVQARLDAIASHWHVLRVEPAVVERARRPFPGEPIRTLDALHLASAVIASGSVDDLALLTLDERIRRAGFALGFRILPT
ncbi:MAG: type II toxin-antitoxin system VapC family toxin [Candidatus Rokubacteria bacterium]|nr:type II toxin-antitoxin system VapC family toxin [Candidatus Rokubacteria bacterium]